MGLAAIGVYRFAKSLYSASASVYKYMMSSRHDLKERYGGGWAVVVGATGSIGRVFAHELAREGFNVVVIARNESRLDELVE